MNTDIDNDWMHMARSVTKYDPAFRDENGYYTKDDWTSRSDIGKIYDGRSFTLELYLETEQKYIAAAKLFFQFHNCSAVLIGSLEKRAFSAGESSFPDYEKANLVYHQMAENGIILLNDLDTVTRLILREYIWCELFCAQSKDIAVRFGYDYYMYFNSPLTMEGLFKTIEEMGLFIW